VERGAARIERLYKSDAGGPLCRLKLISASCLGSLFIAVRAVKFEQDDLS
jgi:hypothetical protein